tara:strand:+ start:6307 stop:7104 length:798 start_codon:yes stop_codon:yes gene_type:complete
LLEVFELEMLGGKIENRFRQMRPEINDMPWGTLDLSGFPQHAIVAAQQAWTTAAFQEFRTGAACAATVQAMIEARAPLDLIGLASRFPLDEMVHTELCSRIASELGGGIELQYDPETLVGDIGAGAYPLLKAAHLVVAFFCVGEALSIPLLHGTGQASTHPLIQAVLRRIVLDEADHGTFGWTFLDWANPHLNDAERQQLAQTADQVISNVHRTWDEMRQRDNKDVDQAYALGWLGTSEYLALAERSLERLVIKPLRQRGILVKG